MTVPSEWFLPILVRVPKLFSLLATIFLFLGQGSQNFCREISLFFSDLFWFLLDQDYLYLSWWLFQRHWCGFCHIILFICVVVSVQCDNISAFFVSMKIFGISLCSWPTYLFTLCPPFWGTPKMNLYLQLTSNSCTSAVTPLLLQLTATVDCFSWLLLCCFSLHYLIHQKQHSIVYQKHSPAHKLSSCY